MWRIFEITIKATPAKFADWLLAETSSGNLQAPIQMWFLEDLVDIETKQPVELMDGIVVPPGVNASYATITFDGILHARWEDENDKVVRETRKMGAVIIVEIRDFGNEWIQVVGEGEDSIFGLDDYLERMGDKIQSTFETLKETKTLRNPAPGRQGKTPRPAETDPAKMEGGRGKKLTKAQKRAKDKAKQAKQLREGGKSRGQIAGDLHVSLRTVDRYLDMPSE